MNLYLAVLLIGQVSVENIKNLNADDYRIRDEAQTLLEQQGEQARDDLEKIKNHISPEVRVRANNLIKKLDIEKIWQHKMEPEPGTCISGPFKLSLVSVKRNFSDEYDFKSKKSDVVHNLNFVIRAEVHDSLNLIGEKLSKIEALVDGKDIAYAPTASNWAFPTRYNLPDYNLEHYKLNLTSHFKIKPTPVKKIDKLKIYWDMYAIGPEKVILAEFNKTTYAEDLEIEVENDAISLSSNTLFNAFAGQSLGREIVVDVIGKDDEEKKVSLIFTMDGSAVRVKLTHKIDKPKAIRLHYHPLRSIKTMVFEFNDVELPSSAL